MRPEKNPHYDQPEQKTFPLNVNRERMALHLGNCAIALFRHRPEMDYLAVAHEDESWTFLFGYHELITWMGGVALGKDRSRTLHLAERNNRTFYERFGWNPDVVIEDYPNKDEEEQYVLWESTDVRESTGIPIDFLKD